MGEVVKVDFGDGKDGEFTRTGLYYANKYRPVNLKGSNVFRSQKEIFPNFHEYLKENCSDPQEKSPI